MLSLPTYTWRGKTYKTIVPLYRAVLKQMPNGAVSFDRDFMHVRLAGPRIVSYRRTFDAQDNSIIASEPEPPHDLEETSHAVQR